MKFSLILFMIVISSASAWEKVYLVSFPRSGNHWVRFLVEEASRIATSSMYRDSDYPHLPDKFPWGAYSTNHGYSGKCRYPAKDQAVLIKTHYPFLFKKVSKPVGAKICLIRHPLDALYSFYIYKQKKFNQPLIFSEFIRSKAAEWKRFYEFWETEEHVVTIRYEDLYACPIPHLSRILEILNYTVQESNIERAITLFPPQGGLEKHKERYSEQDREFIRNELKDFPEKYGYIL